MFNTAFIEQAENINNRKVEYSLYQNLWNKYDLSSIDLAFYNWSTIKYLNDDGTGLNSEIQQIPNNKGGLYLFFVKCPVISGITEFPLYIGRAQLTNGQNLRKRCKEYFQLYSRTYERPKITKMFEYWKNELYLSFLELEDNLTIMDYEKKLINSLLLPMNDVIPDKEISNSVKAF